jgi:hypothetical protein
MATQKERIEALEAEVKELRRLLESLQARVSSMPQHDYFKPIGPTTLPVPPRTMPRWPVKEEPYPGNFTVHLSNSTKAEAARSDA